MKNSYESPYSSEIESQMIGYFNQLDEKGKRHYAAIESLKLDWGGQTYIANLFNISRSRLNRGRKQIQDAKLLDQLPKDKQRLSGGGRKKKRKNFQI